MTRMIMGLCVGALAFLGTELDAHTRWAEVRHTTNASRSRVQWWPFHSSAIRIRSYT